MVFLTANVFLAPGRLAAGGKKGVNVATEVKVEKGISDIVGALAEAREQPALLPK
jgi:hypothetical protein